jgi:long-chain acyl-CoA synthetase
VSAAAVAPAPAPAERAPALPLPFRSVPHMLRVNARRLGARPALKYRKQGAWVTLGYDAFRERALMVARGLSKLGIRAGDRAAILSENRAGWVIADMGILSAGAVTVPIYPTSTPEQIEYLLRHCGAQVVFVSTRVQYQKLLQIRPAIPEVRLVVSFERFLGDPALPVCTFYQLSEIDHPVTDAERAAIEERIDGIAPDDLLSVIYTSGTTGVPKAVALTHGNALFEARYARQAVPQLGDAEVMLSCLPLSHVLERAVGYYMTLAHGCLMAFADSIEKVPENMREIRPTAMIGVPRLFEKIHARVFQEVQRMPAARRRLFRWALEAGREYVRARFLERRRDRWVALRRRIADRLVFAKLRARFGGRLKLFVCGGAPLDPEIAEFFWIVGLPVLEGYGLTETTAAVTLNTFEAVRFGSVGRALPGADLRIAPDGELLVRGPYVMAGYEGDPAATEQAFTPDGFFRTGDLGRIEDGFVFITDRKKELIITAGGKNIAPQPIENELKRDPLVSQACVHGDRRPYLTALLVPNLERLLEWAHAERIPYCDVEDLVANDAVVRRLGERIAEVNARLPRHEQVKRFVLLPRDFSLEGGELSPSLKLRRRVIHEKYKDKIERMYADAA